MSTLVYMISEMPANPPLLMHFSFSLAFQASTLLLLLAAMFTWEVNQLLKDWGAVSMSALQKQSKLRPLPGFLDKPQPFHPLTLPLDILTFVL